MTKRDTITIFGEVLEEYRTRKGLSQKAFATAMIEHGYPKYSQRLHSHVLYNPKVRIYPEFFQVAGDVLDLSIAECQRLIHAWLELACIPEPQMENEL